MSTAKQYRGDGCAIFEVRNNADVYLDTVTRSVRQHSGWQSVRYLGMRFQLFGGIRGPFYIRTSLPIRRQNR